MFYFNPYKSTQSVLKTIIFKWKNYKAEQKTAKKIAYETYCSGSAYKCKTEW